ncbi:MAG: DEAD/DEAH box helicase [Chloroflexi bacterium]|nr:DEAD/DEAH box helicase [Chloroflexota bacterium]
MEVAAHVLGPFQGSTRQRGRLWVFLPTQTETTLQGILNAPWGTNADRENVLNNSYNQALVEHAADLVAASVQELATQADPGAFLDALPARDDVGWADRALAEGVYGRLTRKRCMPSATRGLHVPSILSVRPGSVHAADLDTWFQEFGGLEPDSITHRSVDARDRAARAVRLGCQQLGIDDWLGRVAAKRTPESSIAAIRLAGTLLDLGSLSQDQRRAVRWAKFVLTHTGELVSPDASRVAIVLGGNVLESDHPCLVHPEVAADDLALKVLGDKFGLVQSGSEAICRALLGGAEWPDLDWDVFWRHAKRLTADVIEMITSDLSWVKRKQLRVRTMAGEYREIPTVLLPGTVVHEPVSDRERTWVIDTTYHAEELQLLIQLGARSAPEVVDELFGKLGQDYMLWARGQFLSYCENRRPQRHLIGFVERAFVAPLDPLPGLSAEAATRMTSALLPLATQAATWTMHHTSQPASYPKVPVEALIRWVLRQHGRLSTSLGPRTCQEAVSPALRLWAPFLPVAECSAEHASLFNLPRFEAELSPGAWERGLQEALHYTGEEQELGSFYAAAAHHDAGCPDQMRCRLGGVWTTRSPQRTTVTCDSGDAEVLQSEGRAVIVVPSGSDCDTLVERWGLQRGDPAQLRHLAVTDAERVTDRFPGLSDTLPPPSEILLQSCEELWLESRSPTRGRTKVNVEVAFRDDCLYYTGEREPAWILDQLQRQLRLDLDDDTIRSILVAVDEQALAARLESIRSEPTLAARLEAAVGDAALKAGIPERHRHWLDDIGESGPHAAARLALAVYGVEVLKEYTQQLRQHGLQPPSRWDGGPAAVRFVGELGFPEGYAGFPGRQRPPWEDVLGPATLPPLHGFQDQMRSEIRNFLRFERPSRGVLCLPTGAGKTRVVVQSTIEWIRSGDRDATILWITQTDELCEQAVESWRQAWRAFGPEDAPLRINRMWGETSKRVQKRERGANLVVCTYQTLIRRLDTPSDAWVFEPGLVVIDEAHGAIAPSFTRILRRLGLSERVTSRPLIGLTATPFRGENDPRETLRLAFRFCGRRFDERLGEQPQLYASLQRDGVLAHADHHVLEGDELELHADEMEHLRTFGELPSSVEQRLAGSRQRNQRILDDIRDRPDTWPILLFAASVDHAEDIAVRLSMEGIPAFALSSRSSRSRRRHAIQQFKEGTLRVLTNYGVLTTGFDAPAVRAVYVTRPVYSPVLYQQMVGRGLRGPENGGKERCLVVNVSDNVRNYGEELAFHRFEYLWREQGSQMDQ